MGNLLDKLGKLSYHISRSDYQSRTPKVSQSNLYSDAPTTVFREKSVQRGKYCLEWNGHLEIFSRPQVIENPRQYLLRRTDILQKTVVRCP